MVLKIYGYPMSAATRRVALVCKELRIPYELTVVDLATGAQKAPEYLDRWHPFGQVPAIDDDGLRMYESRAICRYLAAKAGSPLYPATSAHAAHAQFEQAASVELAHYDPAAATLTFERLIKQRVLQTGVAPDERLVAELVDTLDGKLAVYDKILSAQKYLSGDEITLVDLFHLPYGFMLESKLGYDFFRTKPNVARWWTDISSRETWQSVQNGA
ncbi:glutathione S-transferase [Gautieria morchelliformis]|nr:glutathione S-transferase [Gautieria morchelliformis]